ncbi:MAG TPA: glycine cleavage system protein H [Sphingomonadales bacterium]|nr:glycine cleavage system protein H [Sphingomonadales bacterium]
MTVILVLATFIIFLTIDYFYSRRHAPVMAAEAQREPLARLLPKLVGGFSLPENLRYHMGHTWALSESPNLVRVGVDDFASRLIGRVDSATLPKRGQWIRQGQRLWTVERNGVKAEMVSPIEGVVTEINEAVVNDPMLALRNPYGEGWLITVQAPDAKTNFRNLLSGAVARKWMEEAATRLRARLDNLGLADGLATAGALAQDGGVALADLCSAADDKPEAWAEVTREFFLS